MSELTIADTDGLLLDSLRQCRRIAERSLSLRSSAPNEARDVRRLREMICKIELLQIAAELLCGVSGCVAQGDPAPPVPNERGMNHRALPQTLSKEGAR